MAIKSTTRRIQPQNRQVSRRAVTAGTSIASQVTRKGAQPITAGIKLSPEKAIFANQLKTNIRRSITAATNTSNIMARPDFLELLPIFVQKLHLR